MKKSDQGLFPFSRNQDGLFQIINWKLHFRNLCLKSSGFTVKFKLNKHFSIKSHISNTNFPNNQFKMKQYNIEKCLILDVFRIVFFLIKSKHSNVIHFGKLAASSKQWFILYFISSKQENVLGIYNTN